MGVETTAALRVVAKEKKIPDGSLETLQLSYTKAKEMHWNVLSKEAYGYWNSA